MLLSVLLLIVVEFLCVPNLYRLPFHISLAVLYDFVVDIHLLIQSSDGVCNSQQTCVFVRDYLFVYIHLCTFI